MSFVDTTTADGGQADPSTQPEANTSVESDVAQPAEKPAIYTVKVAGVELEVDLDEMRNGYMRNADYTRKQQALAAQRAELEQAATLANALKRDPESTLRALAAEFGVADLASESYDDDDPSSGRIRELEQRLELLSQREVERQIDREVNDIKSKYEADDGQIAEAMEYASRNGVNLATAYRDLFFDDAFEIARQVRARRVAEAEIVDQKRTASVVHLGTSNAGTGEVPKDRSYFYSKYGKGIRASLEAAKQGIRFDD